MRVKLQDPAETEEYTIDWADYLGTDTVSSADWSVSPTGPTTTGDSNDTRYTSTLLSGVSHGTIYTLTCEMTTAGGLTGERSITIRGAQR